MELIITGRNLEIDPLPQERISRKLERIARQLPAATSAKVELTFEPTRAYQERLLAQVSLTVNGVELRAERRGPSAIAAINAAAIGLAQSAARFKGHAYRSQRARQYRSIGTQQAEDMLAEDRELAWVIGAGDADVELPAGGQASALSR